ncbi:hypothetical protein SDC9_190019 [bioreactor metagenome]|uniref:Uncharacterized protein n=1 Tax=bioreactor metagenome TaxID=1076179 RepID=A0A645HVG7_9ZZZZ
MQEELRVPQFFDPRSSEYAFFLQYMHDVVICVPVMDHNGHIKFQGKLDLPAKPILLDVPFRMVIVIVQADFPDGFHLRLFGQAPEHLQSLFIHGLRVVGMTADGCIAPGIYPCVLYGHDRACQVKADVHDVLQVGPFDGFDDPGPLGVIVFFTVDMRMRIE